MALPMKSPIWVEDTDSLITLLVHDMFYLYSLHSYSMTSYVLSTFESQSRGLPLMVDKGNDKIIKTLVIYTTHRHCTYCYSTSIEVETHTKLVLQTASWTTELPNTINIGRDLKSPYSMIVSLTWDIFLKTLSISKLRICDYSQILTVNFHTILKKS